MDINERIKKTENNYTNIKEQIRKKQEEINKLNEELFRLQGEYRVLVEVKENTFNDNVKYEELKQKE